MIWWLSAADHSPFAVGLRNLSGLNTKVRRQLYILSLKLSQFAVQTKMLRLASRKQLIDEVLILSLCFLYKISNLIRGYGLTRLRLGWMKNQLKEKILLSIREDPKNVFSRPLACSLLLGACLRHVCSFFLTLKLSCESQFYSIREHLGRTPVEIQFVLSPEQKILVHLNLVIKELRFQQLL